MRIEEVNGSYVAKYVDSSDPNVELTEEQFKKVMAQAKTAKADTNSTRASQSGKDAKRSIPLTERFTTGVQDEKKEKEKK